MIKKLIFLCLFLLMANLSHAEEFYIGKWEWCTDELDGYWCAPQKQFLTGVIDLRSLPQQSAVSGTPEGWAFFSYSQAVVSSSLFNLSNALDKKLNNPVISKIETELEITLQATTVRDAIWEVLTLHGDPTGQTSWKPLIPGVDLKRKVYFGSEGNIKEKAFKMFESKGWELVLATIQDDYRHLIKDERYEIVARWLDSLEEQYGVFYGYFMPNDSVMIASLPHQTTITEDWNCADSDSPNCDLSWTEIEGDVDIVSNTGRANSATEASARADSDLSSANHYSKAKLSSNTAGDSAYDCAVLVRKDSTATITNYLGIFRGVSVGGNDAEFYKRVAGAYTSLGSYNGGTNVVSGNIIYLELNGSTYTQKIGTTTYITGTDTAITGNLRTGIWGYGTFAGRTNFDDFEAGDLSSPGTADTRASGVWMSGVWIR